MIILKIQKKIWDTIQEAANEYHNATNIGCVKTDSGQVVTDTLEIANEFNDFFSSIGLNLAQKITSIPQENETICNRSMFLRPVTESELITVIGSLKNTSSCGDDGITSITLKTYHTYLLKPLLHLINSIFATGNYPKLFKNSVIIPIHKAGDKTDKNNYRPIALCSVLSKVVEKCIKEKLWNFLEENSVISPNQFGFKPGVSTDNALQEVNQFISTSINKTLKPAVVFLDLKKAFDTVAHPVLLKRLKAIGIRGLVYKLFESYLNDRVQKVKINDVYSELQKVTVGVPQGTVLGPVLFSVYVNSLLSLNVSGKIVCFADDTALLISGHSWHEVFRKADVDLHKIKCWLDANQLTLNIDKTKFIPFSMNRQGMPTGETLKLHDSNCDLSFSCKCTTKIESCDSIRYLGVCFDRFMKWDTHINYVSKKIRKLVYKFSQLRHILPLKLTKMVYAALTESILNYGILSWGSACESVLLPLKIAQKYILKTMLSKPKMYPTDLLFSESEILNIRQLYCLRVIQFSLKFNVFPNLTDHNVQTRAVTGQKYATSLQHFSFTQRSILFTGPRLLNMLPLKLKNGPLNKSTRENIKKWVLVNYKVITKTIVWFY